MEKYTGIFFFHFLKFANLDKSCAKTSVMWSGSLFLIHKSALLKHSTYFNYRASPLYINKVRERKGRQMHRVNIAAG